MRVALAIEYNGAKYSGWQIQPKLATVQQELEFALSKVANQTISKSQVAGRTDKGVHATEQVVHFDTDVMRSEKAWVYGANRYLTSQHISVLWAKHVSTDFHARFSALRRRYRYILLNRAIRPSFLSSLVAWENRPLDLSLMQQASLYLLGTHDFNAYRTVHCQAKSPVKTVYDLKITQQDNFFYFDIEANAFLHHMVRNIVGVLSLIGRGEKPVAWAKTVLDSRDRTQAAMTAPSAGLYLTRVGYDAAFLLPQSDLSLPSMG